MDAQRRVADFIDRHDLDAHPAYRSLDLVSEVGEIAKEINASTDYGTTDDVHIEPDELGDALFALLALAEAVGVDADEALETALEKYTTRLDASGDAGSA